MVVLLCKKTTPYVGYLRYTINTTEIPQVSMNDEPWKTEATFVVIQKSQGQETYQQTTAKYRVFFLVY